MNHESPLAEFGTAEQRVDRAISALKAGNGVLLMDDECRENEGDLVFSAQYLSEEQMALMIRECSGIVCLCITQDRANWLELPPMVERNSSQNQTAFTISIESRVGVTTGVSAKDRVTTIKAATYFDAMPEDLCRPGHVFPLVARSKGVLERRGHTEGAIDLMYRKRLRIDSLTFKHQHRYRQRRRYLSFELYFATRREVRFVAYSKEADDDDHHRISTSVFLAIRILDIHTVRSRSLLPFR